MKWIMQQNCLGAVNLMNVINIFIRRQDNTVVARIAPTVTSKDATMSPYVELGRYKTMDDAKQVLSYILDFLDNEDSIYKMPKEDELI